MRRFRQLMTIGIWALWAPGVNATSNYVGAVNQYPYESNPDGKCGWVGTCVLCHQADPGAKGTVTKDFGKALMDEFGLVGNDQSNAPLTAALDLAKADRLDADGDGVPDLDEICGGGDPNNANIGLGGVAPAVSPEFGCLGSIAGHRDSSNGALIAAAFTALVCAFNLRRT